MVDPEARRAKHPLLPLAGRHGHPLHPALVPLPIGAWVMSVVFDVASYVVDDPGFLVRGATWLLVAGVLTALLAGTIGMLDLVVIPIGTRVYRTAVLHMSCMLLAIAVFSIDALVRRGAELTEPVGPGPLALSVLGLVLLGAGGYLGGELAFRFGVRVVDDSVQAQGFRTQDNRHASDTATPPPGSSPVSPDEGE